MKKLCIGSLLRILSDCKDSQKGAFLFSFLNIVNNNPSNKETSYQNGLMSGKYSTPEVKEKIKADPSILVTYINDKILNELTEDNQKLLIICIRDILNDDPIDDLTKVGYEKEGYTKQDIVNKQVFPFSHFLANIYYYCLTQVENTKYKNELKEVKNYAKNQIDRINEVQLETDFSIVQSKIKMTLNPVPFKKVFTEVKTEKLSIANPNDLKIFRLSVENSQIDYKNLEDYIRRNITNYIFCRSRMNRYKISEDYISIATDALSAYNRKVKTEPSINHFNEILLYSFLECVLNAPKIYSKLELQNKSGEYNSTSSGIHFLNVKHNGQLIKQMVYGASHSINGIYESVDNAFDQVLKIKDKINDEFNLIKENILNNQFDTETLKVLNELIVPNKNSKIDNFDSAFGIFLGYSPSVPEEPDNYKYRQLLVQTLENDLTKIVPYINEKISSLGLNNYSFYIYLLPLNDALTDQITIMKNALEVK